MADLLAAQQAVERADRADADQYAPDMMALARQQLEQAQRAAGDRRQQKQAPLLARRAAKPASTPSHGAGPASTKPATTSSKAQEPVAGKPAAEGV